MNQIIENLKPDYEKVVAHLKEELSALRTGRATPALVENLLVESYGARVPLKQVASISVSDAKTLIVQPWDKNLIVEIEKSISQSDKGLTPAVAGMIIHLSLPPLTEERRKSICKVLHERLEAARIGLREVRDKTKELIIKMFREKEVTEDDKFRLIEDLDKMTTEYNEKIKEIGIKKEEEIMTI